MFDAAFSTIPTLLERTRCPEPVVRERSIHRFFWDVLTGLFRRERRLPCKYFYDEHGAELFETIGGLKEYYLTRTELAITARHAPEMAERIGRDAMLIELGSGGSNRQTTILLSRLRSPVAYVPVDIANGRWQKLASRLGHVLGPERLLPVEADFAEPFCLPAPARRPRRKVVYFPGSAIGNFSPRGTRAMLTRIRALCGDGGGALIGIDLVKAPEMLEAAYNDGLGVTAEFNRNLLRRINRELGGTFDLEGFAHSAEYHPRRRRVTMALESDRRQSARVGEVSFFFAAGERIVTGHCYKHTVPRFAETGGRCRLELRRAWLDEHRYFAMLYFDAV